jgi:capsular polysaccharide biosynthesis protein
MIISRSSILSLKIQKPKNNSKKQLIVMKQIKMNKSSSFNDVCFQKEIQKSHLENFVSEFKVNLQCTTQADTNQPKQNGKANTQSERNKRRNGSVITREGSVVKHRLFAPAGKI